MYGGVWSSVFLKLINDRSRCGVVLLRPASQVVHVNEQEGEHTARHHELTTQQSILRPSASHVGNLTHLSILSEYPVVACHQNKKPAASRGLEEFKRKLKLSSAPVRLPLRARHLFLFPCFFFINRTAQVWSSAQQRGY